MDRAMLLLEEVLALEDTTPIMTEMINLMEEKEISHQELVEEVIVLETNSHGTDMVSVLFPTMVVVVALPGVGGTEGEVGDAGSVVVHREEEVQAVVKCHLTTCNCKVSIQAITIVALAYSVALTGFCAVMACVAGVHHKEIVQVLRGQGH